MGEKPLRWTLDIKPRFEKNFKKQVDSVTQKRVLEALNNLAESEHPEFMAKNLHADLEGLHSYHVGKYRIKYAVNSETRTIDVVDVGLRKNAY